MISMIEEAPVEGERTKEKLEEVRSTCLPHPESAAGIKRDMIHVASPAVPGVRPFLRELWRWKCVCGRAGPCSGILDDRRGEPGLLVV